MKTIFTNVGQLVAIDFDEQTVTPLPSCREAISRIYLVKEKCEVVDGDRTLKANAGDIIIRFYDDSFTYKTVIAKSKDWAKNIKDYENRIKKLNDECNSLKDSDCACESVCKG